MNLFNKVLVRTPIYPIEKINDANFYCLINNKDFVNRVFFCSRVLYEHVQEFNNGKRYSSKEIENIYRALYLYFTRMCSRSTPFEATASYSFCNIIDNECNEITIGDNTKVYYLYDYDFISFFSKMALANPLSNKKIRYKVNPSLMLVGDYYQYIENKEKEYNISRIAFIDQLQGLIENSNDFRTIEELQSFLVKDDVIQNVDDYSILSFLIENKIIISNLEYYLYDKEYIRLIKEIIDSDSGLSRYKFFFDVSKKRYQNLSDLIDNDKLLTKCVLNDNLPESKNINRVFTFNLKRDCKVFLDENYLNKCFNWLLLLFDNLNIKNHNSTYNGFVKAFEDRYESAKIPFLEALDPVVGIGYPVGSIKYDSDLIEGLSLSKDMDDPNYTLSAFDNVLLQKISNLHGNELEINIKESDISFQLKHDNAYTNCFIIGAQCMKKGDNMYLYFNGLLSDTNKMLIRYTHSDKEVREYVQEDNYNVANNTIDADVLYKTNTRIDNILLKDPIHKHVIDCLCGIKSDSKYNVLELKDLYLCMHNGELQLWSEMTQKYVNPHMNGVYNYALSDVCYYRFLSDFSDNRNSYVNDFIISPIIYKIFSFIPRIIFERIILLPACWKINLDEIRMINNILYSDSFNELISKWRADRNIPETVLYQERDTHIFIKWSEKIAVFAFIKKIKTLQKDVWIREFLYDSYESLVCDNENNHYVNEFFFKIKK